ncbi:putative F0F1-ATPase subunit (Ca2+/Mg2+ transporter) [Pedobacter metabolipauper]|uniref:Putative F0F1-ATPase subunit (Ca2+/Mg2+ transporter) n=2 Tax=Pedobacter metabolipauper TaxID=425513 RepID=A0A4V3D0P1_9SPHI|nr:putative F0F1-ATPase subunit (Ca2+/Mg2+ transporter) [Pedobacter metabolipauper]
MTDPKEQKKNVNSFAKYSSISFQMLATIGLFAFAGYKIDEYKQSKTPIFTAILSIAGVVISLYQVVKQLNKNEK